MTVKCMFCGAKKTYKELAMITALQNGWWLKESLEDAKGKSQFEQEVCPACVEEALALLKKKKKA